MSQRGAVAWCVGLALLVLSPALRIAPGQPPELPKVEDDKGAAEASDDERDVNERKVIRALRIAADLIEDERFNEAVRILANVLELDSDFPYRPDATVTLERFVKTEARRLLGGLPNEGLKAYELQFGPQAQRMLEAALAAGDLAKVQEVAGQFPFTEAGQRATYVLASHELDQGFPLAAGVLFGRLLESSTARRLFGPELAVKAAVGWTRAGMGDKAQAMIARGKVHWPNAPLHVGEDRWRLSDSGWLARLADPAAALEKLAPRQWSLFRGDEARNAAANSGTPLLTPRWTNETVAGETLDGLLKRSRYQREEHGAALLPGFHPLVVKDLVVFRTWRRIRAVNYKTGKLAWQTGFFDSGTPVAPRSHSAEQMFAAALSERIWEDRNYGTLASDGERVYAVENLAAPALAKLLGQNGRHDGAWTPGSQMPRKFNRLAAYLLKSGRLVWEAGGADDARPRLQQAGSFFLGPPLPLAGRLYQIADFQGEIRLHVIDAASGGLIYTQRLVEPDEGQTSAIDRHRLRRTAGTSPAYSDGILVCPTSAGMVVAYDLISRSLLWRYSYPRAVGEPPQQNNPFFVPQPSGAKSPDGGRWHDAAVVIANGNVLLTPVESDQIHCIDLMSGKRRWQKPRQGSLYLAAVHDGKAVLVGNRNLRALQLASGAGVWQTPLEHPQSPSGLGLLSGGRYYLPLSTAEVAVFDAAGGRLIKLVKSRRGTTPGNLIAYQDAILSQTVRGVERFDQREAIERRVEKLEQLPETVKSAAELLALRGELLLEDDKIDEAIGQLRSAHQKRPSGQTRELLLDALLVGLKRKFSVYAPAAEEIRALAAKPSQRDRLLSLLAAGYESSGQKRKAFEAYLELARTGAAQDELQAAEPGLSTRRDRWVRSRLGGMLKGMSPREAAELRQAIAAQIEAADRDAKALARMLRYLPEHEIADEVRARLAEASSGASPLAEERALRRLAASGDQRQRGLAASRLAELYQRAGRSYLAAGQYRLLNGELAEVVCREGKTGRELVAALDDAAVSRLLGPPSWPAGKVVTQSSNGAGTTVYVYPVPIVNAQNPGDLIVTLNPQQQLVFVYNRDGRLLFNTRLGSQYNPYSNYYLNRAWVSGQLLIVSTGVQVFGIDMLGGKDRKPGAVLWQHDVYTFDPRNPRRGFSTSITTLPWGEMRYEAVDSKGRRLGPLALINDGLFCLGRHGVLLGIDPLSGDVLWRREGVPAGSGVFGGEQRVFVVRSGGTKATVLETATGRELGQRNVPPVNQWMRVHSGKLVAWEGSATVKLIDPWENKTLWRREFNPGAKASFSGDVMGVLKPVGDFYLISLSNGELITHNNLDAIPSLEKIFLFRSPTRWIVAATKPYRTSGIVRVSPIQGGTYLNPPITGHVSGIDRRTGKLKWLRKIEHQALLLQQPSRVPVMAFACRKYHRDPKRGAVTSSNNVSILCLDKRNGNVLMEKESPGYTYTVDLVADEKQHAVEVRTMMETVKLKFTK